MRSSPDYKHTHSCDVCDPFVIITPRFYNIIASSPDRKHTHTHTHTCDGCDPFVIIIPRFYNIIASSPDYKHTHSSQMRRMRSVCNHHSKILQHHRIITGLQTHTLMRSACNHHSEILQHHRIITGLQTHTHSCDVCDPFVIILQHHRIITGLQTHTHSCDVCDPLVIISPRFYNIIASSTDRKHTPIRLNDYNVRKLCSLNEDFGLEDGTKDDVWIFD